MTKQHDLGHYQDGRVSVAYCKRCSAEGDTLLENCPQKIENFLQGSEKSLDEKKQTAK